jgi:hypothetical protein
MHFACWSTHLVVPSAGGRSDRESLREFISGARRYRGGPSAANAAFTVFLATPITRAISETAIPSARRNRRISAQSSTSSTCFLPSSNRARVSGKLVNFQFPRGGQFSVAADIVEPFRDQHCDLATESRDGPTIPASRWIVVPPEQRVRAVDPKPGMD